jgi:heptosyltransferase-1
MGALRHGGTGPAADRVIGCVMGPLRSSTHRAIGPLDHRASGGIEWRLNDAMAQFLVIRLSSIGDIVHALPAVAALGEAFPQARIHWAVERRYAALLEGNPFVHRVLEIDTLGWRRKLSAVATLEEIARRVMELRETAYAVAVDFQGLLKSAAIAWLSRSRERLGLAEYWLKEPVAGVFYTERVTPRRGVHAIQEGLALVERLISTRTAAPGSVESLHDQTKWKFPLPHSAEADRCVEQQLAGLGVRNFIVISPGGGWMAKRWAPENYAQLIRCLEPQVPHQVLLVGSANEEPMIKEILDRAGGSRAAYFRSTLVQFIALARRASLFLGGDTGPTHLAAAVGVPIVAIYGPTDPARNGPFCREDIALSNLGTIDHTRRGKNPNHLPGIPVESVVVAIRRRLARVGQRRG